MLYVNKAARKHHGRSSKPGDTEQTFQRINTACCGIEFESTRNPQRKLELLLFSWMHQNIVGFLHILYTRTLCHGLSQNYNINVFRFFFMC